MCVCVCVCLCRRSVAQVPSTNAPVCLRLPSQIEFGSRSQARTVTWTRCQCLCCQKRSLSELEGRSSCREMDQCKVNCVDPKTKWLLRLVPQLEGLDVQQLPPVLCCWLALWSLSFEMMMSPLEEMNHASFWQKKRLCIEDSRPCLD